MKTAMPTRPPPRRLSRRAHGYVLRIWLALLALLGLGWAGTYFNLHGANTALSLAVAAVQIALIGRYFVGLPLEQKMPKLVALVVLLLLAVIVALSVSDAIEAGMRSVGRLAPLSAQTMEACFCAFGVRDAWSD